MSSQQTVLRVQTNIPGEISGTTTYEFLDLYSSIPILINKSFAELGDIGKKNSDYSLGVLLPGSKKNNSFFENFFNVDASSLYFNPNKRVGCNVLISDEAYFTGYMRLNKVSVQDSKIEYDVTLYSTPAELYGSIGNNLLKDLDFNDEDYTFNHVFNLENVTQGFNYGNFSLNQEEPYPYFYPVVHNGYLYTGSTVNFTGGTILSRTRLYTSTANSAGQLGSYTSQAAAFADGVQQYRINSPGQGLYDNQLKPGLNIWSLLKLTFKTYGYEITSDFFNTPWMKTLYMYGYFSSDQTKFSFQVNNIQTLPIEGVEVFFVQISGDVYCVVSKLGTGIPSFCDSDINVRLVYNSSTIDLTIPYGTSGLTVNSFGQTFTSGSSTQVPNGATLKYLPVPVGTAVNYVDGDFVDFSLVIDQNIKQIDVLSSIAKKFNLVLIPDPNNGSKIRIEPYDFFIGTGEVHNWSDKISYDKGFTVEPALNYIESELQITDQDDNDEGNKLFKESNNRVYGQNFVYNPTDFKSQVKKIDTIFSPELIRKWDADGASNIGLPLGINYVSSNNQVGSGSTVNVNWIYKGVKTKPKLFWWLGCFNPFLDLPGEHYNATNYWTTYEAYISNTSGTTFTKFDRIPVISHTMPMGNPDSNKINNDSQCILFNSEFPADTNINVQTFNTYTENDAYSTFYDGRVSNLYNPNTRVVNGFFNLNYADLKNLQPQDLIKIQEQYFVVSKIEGFNLTNRDLTKVELVQYNNRPKTYTDRYFQYFYCDNTSKVYKFQTDFTNSNLLDSNFGWSVYYDHQIGSLGSSGTGFTSTFKDVINFSTEVYVPYFIYEVSESTYNASGIPWEYDSLHNYIYSSEFGPFQYNMPTFWLNSGSTETGINLFTDCADFNTVRTTYGILTGSSTNHGIAVTPTPTPTPTPSPTPGASERMRGSLIISYDEPDANLATTYVNVLVNSENRQLVQDPITNLYSTFIYSGDVVNVKITTSSTTNSIDVTRRDYTTDDQNGDNGIRDTFITGTTGSSVSGFYQITFNVEPNILDYNFEYRVVAETLVPVTPTPTPSPTPVPCFSMTTGYTNGYTLTGGTLQSRIEEITVLDNNDFYAGGSYWFYDGYAPRSTVPYNGTCLLKLYAEGPRISSYSGSTFFDGTPGDDFPIVYKVLPSTGSTILVGGNFHKYLLPSGTSDVNGPEGITRLNSDSTRNTSFKYNNTGTSAGFKISGGNGTVYDIAENTDNTILCISNAISYFDDSSHTTAKLTKLNSDGTFVTSGFNQIALGDDSQPYKLKILSDGKILAAGRITYYRSSGGTLTYLETKGNLVRLLSNGNLDTSFVSGFNIFDSGGFITFPAIVGIEVQSDNKIICIGSFNKYSGSTVPAGIIRLNSNATIDTSFSGFTSGFNTQPYALKLQSDGKILVGGDFTSFNGVSKKGIIRLNSDGSIDNTFTSPTTFELNVDSTITSGGVMVIETQSDGKILVGGSFTNWDGTSYNGALINNFVRLNSDGTLNICNGTPVIPTSTPTPTPSSTGGLTPTPTLTSTPTPTPTASGGGASLRSLVLWWMVNNGSTPNTSFSNTIFDYTISWEYLGTTGSTTAPSMTQVVTNSIGTYNVATLPLPSYLNSATNINFTVNRKLCGTRPTGQSNPSSTIYYINSNSTSLPPTWGDSDSQLMQGCVKTCPTIYAELLPIFNSFTKTITPYSYLHIMVQDTIGNSSC